MAAQNKTDKAISLLEQKSKELVELLNKEVFKRSDYYAYYFGKWRSETEYIFIHIFGEDSRELKKFEVAAKLPLPIGTAEQIRRQLPKDRRGTMLRAAREIEAILSIIKEYGLPEKREAAIPPQAFIAHGGETKALSKLRDFLEALGLGYSIAERNPSDGRLLEEQVIKAYESADFAIILATKGGIVDKKTGAEHMRMNVADELGRVRAVFKNRIILLLEKGVEPHINISGIVRERFTPASMDKALIKIAKDLREWGLIRASTSGGRD
jgi:hypothetical protein